MDTLIEAKGLKKHYGREAVLKGLDLRVERGRIVGLVGPNGAGKTTALKCILGLAPYEGDLHVLGIEPKKSRARLMEQVSFIADTATLPGWMTARQALQFMTGVHPRFRPEKAEGFLAKTQIPPTKPVRKLSKGMITQLHLALVMAIDVPLMVLDEPTLGLDILYRQQFYNSLLDDYFDQERTIIVTTHQVEEIASLLTDVLFIGNGELVLDSSMEDLAERFVEVRVTPDKADAARALNPIHEHVGIGEARFVFENTPREQLSALGELRIPSLTELFVAKMQDPQLQAGA